MPTTISTGADLTDWRGRLGWSTQRAADELRILPPSLRNLEAGRKTASGALLRLAEVLEMLEARPVPAAAPAEVSPVSSRKPRTKKAVAPVPTDPFLAAMWRANVRSQMPAEALALLKAAVERRQAGYEGGLHGGPAVGEDLVVWRVRERAWHTAKGGEPGAPLNVVAGMVERALATER